jgi:hypothetical protein
LTSQPPRLDHCNRSSCCQSRHKPACYVSSSGTNFLSNAIPFHERVSDRTGKVEVAGQDKTCAFPCLDSTTPSSFDGNSRDSRHVKAVDELVGQPQRLILSITCYSRARAVVKTIYCLVTRLVEQMMSRFPRDVCVIYARAVSL